MDFCKKKKTGNLYALTRSFPNFLTHFIRDRRISCIVLGLTIHLFFSESASAGTSAVYQASGKSLDTMVVTGKVRDGNGNPLPGVVVRAMKSKKGTVSGTSGEYQIAEVSHGSILFSFLGYEPQTISVANRKVLDVVMKTAATGLNEVIVTGFQEIDKKKFAGVSARLKAEDIRMEGATDISRAIEGKVAGVSIQNVSSTFGAAPKVRIRGATSLTGDNKPLWVVDGIVLEDVVDVTNDQLASGNPITLLSSSVAGLNINDVEDTYILKDAAATSLYGARAMNGVVVINTKKGRSGKMSVGYKGSFSTQLKPDYNNFNIMNSAEQMSVYAELARKGMLNLADIGNRPNKGVYGKMYDELQTYDVSTGAFGVENTPEGRARFLRRYALANTDWFDILFKNSLIQEHTISLAGGSDKVQSYFSVGFYNDNGWTIVDKVKRFTFNAQNNYKFNDRFSASFLTNGSLRQQEAPGTVERTINNFSGLLERDFDINPYQFALNTSRALTPYDEKGELEYFKRNYAPFNILNELQSNKLKLSVVDIKLQASATYKISKHLKYDFLGAIRYVKTAQEDLVQENSNKVQAYRAEDNAIIAAANRFLYKDADRPNSFPQVILPIGGFYNRRENTLLNYNIRNSLNYTQTFGEHDLNVLVGQEIKYADRQNAFNTGYGYQFDYGGAVLPNYLAFKRSIEEGNPYFGMGETYDRYAAFFATAGYTFQQRYNLTGSLRTDGSNRLGKSPSARWLPTWSISGAWNVDQESFLKDIRNLSLLKLRASYGLTADMGVATNSSVVLGGYSTTRQYSRYVEPAIEIVNLENAALTWEKQYSMNVGFDVAFFDNRLTATIDLYKKNGFDLIASMRTAAIGGEVNRTANYANLITRGVEATVGTDIIRSKPFNWKTNLTFGWNNNEITNAKNRPVIFDLVEPNGGNKEGYPVNGLFSLNYKGLEGNTGIPVFVNEKGEISRKVILQDIETKYLVYEGPLNPPVYGGWSNTFRYKGLSLNVLISYQVGNKIRLNPVFKATYTDLDAFPREFLSRWTLPGDEKVTTIPSIMDALVNHRIADAFPYNNYNYSSARTASGSFARVKYMELSYTLPAGKFSNAGISNLTVSGSASNLWLLYSDSKLKGQDPEFFNAGGVAQPLQRQLVLSLKVGL